MVAVVTQAKAAADASKKTLLLYFATDYEQFRPIVTRVLSNLATPTFGLLPEEIGHLVYGR